MKSGFLFAAALSLTACASTAMKGYVGKSISEAFMSYGQPANTFDLADGRRAFQFYWGGGAAVIPERSSSTITPGWNNYEVTTTTSPALLIDSPGCLVTLIAKSNGSDFIVEEYRIPKRAVC